MATSKKAPEAENQENIKTVELGEKSLAAIQHLADSIAQLAMSSFASAQASLALKVVTNFNAFAQAEPASEAPSSTGLQAKTASAESEPIVKAAPKKAAVTSTTFAPAPTPAAEPEKQVDLTAIRTKIQEKAAAQKTAEIVGLLTRYGAKNASTLAEENYGAFYNDLCKI